MPLEHGRLLKDMHSHLPQKADPDPPQLTTLRGRRPEFTDDPMLDRLYAITLALVAELSVTGARVDTLERLLDHKGLIGSSEIESFTPDESEAARRSEIEQQYLDRIFRTLTE